MPGKLGRDPVEEDQTDDDLDDDAEGARKHRQPVSLARLKAHKKEMIENACDGLVELIEPEHDLDMVVGHEAAKKRLRDDAELIANNHLDAVPMGYLLCGPVGTGKS